MKGFQKIEARSTRHFDIEKEGVGLLLADEFQGGRFGASFADDLKVGMRCEELTKALEGKPFVITEDYTEHGSPFRSSVATTNPFS